MSIVNQRRLLGDYATEKGWDVFDTYVDDGCTGTNFDRPDFKRMIKDAEKGRINCIITKDLSRLGRNTGGCERYIEEVFPDLNVRFIAINDGVDTGKGFDVNDDIIPFRHAVNETIPRQASRKTRQGKQLSASRGFFIGSQAPYGYMKSPEDKHKLVIDEVPAQIVRRIFTEFASGDSGRMIADRLNGEGIDSPRFYHYRKVGRVNPLTKEKNVWGSGTVMALLRNQVYLGVMAQGKRAVINYRTKKRREIDPQDWIIVEGTHEPIIEREVWESVHGKLGRKEKVRKTKNGAVGLFSGRIFCADCKSPLAYTPRPRKSVPDKYVYRCSRFNNNGGKACSTHNIDEGFLSEFVMNDIRLYARLTVAERERLSKMLLREMTAQQDSESKALRSESTKIDNRLLEITSRLKNLYEDKCRGKIPEELAISLMNGFVKEQQDLEDKRALLAKKIQTVKNAEGEITDWIDLIEQQLDIVELDRATVMALIDRIEVSEARDVNGERRQDVSIQYRFVGNLLENNKESIA